MSEFDMSAFDISELPLIGRGRAADVFGLGGQRVLRRYRTPHPGFVEREAVAMEFLRARGAPVPEVFDAGGDDLVMERNRGVQLLSGASSHSCTTGSVRAFAAAHCPTAVD